LFSAAITLVLELSIRTGNQVTGYIIGDAGFDFKQWCLMMALGAKRAALCNTIRPINSLLHGEV
jgi:hypothetical protein